MTDTDKLAAQFALILNGWLSPAEMDEVRSRNRTHDYEACCASHDFCDANVAMAEAFASAIGREPDLSSEHDIDLWNAAWTQAKSKEFRL